MKTKSYLDGALGALAIPKARDLFVSFDQLQASLVDYAVTGGAMVGSVVAWNTWVNPWVRSYTDEYHEAIAPALQAVVGAAAAIVGTRYANKAGKAGRWMRRAAIGVGAGLVGFGVVKTVNALSPGLIPLGNVDDVLMLEGAAVSVEAAQLNGAAVEIESVGSTMGGLESAFGASSGMGGY